MTESQEQKTRRSRLRGDWVWPVAVLLVVLAGLWWFPTPSGGGADSRSTLPRGKKAFFQWLSAFEPKAARSMERLPPAPEGKGHTLLVLGPARNPKPKEWARLKAWVEAGNTLIFAAHFERPVVDLAPFPVQVVLGSATDPLDDLKRLGDAGASGILGDDDDTDDATGVAAPSRPRGARVQADDPKDATPLDGAKKDGAKKDGAKKDPGENPFKKDRKVTGGTILRAIKFLTRVKYQAVDTALVKGEVKWASKGTVQLAKGAPEAEILVRLRGGGAPQAARLHLGEGILVVIASDEVFTNRSLLKGGPTRLVAWRLFEQRGGAGPVHLDEYLNYTGTPQTVGLLFDPLFRPLTLQIVLCAVLFGWLGFRRFGPPKAPLAPPRRSIVEHAEALGNLQYRAQAGGHAVAAYLDWWRGELHQQGGARGQAELVQRLALASGRPPADIHRLLHEAAQAAQVAMPPARATVLIRELARLRAALRRDAKR